MSMPSVCRRLISGKITSSPILHRRKLCTAAAATKELLRPSSSPYLMLPHSFIGCGRDMVYMFYSLIDDKVVSLNNKGGTEETQLMQGDKTKLVGCSHGWLALYNSGNHGMYLLNPISNHCIDLPPLAVKPFSDGEVGVVKPGKLIMSCPPDEEECRVLLVIGNNVGVCCPDHSLQ